MRRHCRLWAISLCVLFVVLPALVAIAGCKKGGGQPSASDMPDMMRKGMEMRKEKMGTTPPVKGR